MTKRLGDEFYGLLTDAWPRERLSLVHNDYHPANWFVDGDGADDPIVVFDWQSMCAGRNSR